jgi:hypothetical protein
MNNLPITNLDIFLNRIENKEIINKSLNMEIPNYEVFLFGKFVIRESIDSREETRHINVKNNTQEGILLRWIYDPFNISVNGNPYIENPYIENGFQLIK